MSIQFTNAHLFGLIRNVDENVYVCTIPSAYALNVYRVLLTFVNGIGYVCLVRVPNTPPPYLFNDIDIIYHCRLDSDLTELNNNIASIDT
jgi:hypothetical protein